MDPSRASGRTNEIVRRLSPCSLGSRVKRFADRRRPAQFEGGARAWNRKCGEAANADGTGKCRPIGPGFAGSAKVGAVAGAEVADSWIRAQIAQSAPADPSDLLIGPGLPGGGAPPSCAVAAGAALAETKPS